MNSLQISLLVAGGVTLLAVVLYNQWVSRKSAPRQADDSGGDAALAETTADGAAVEPVLEDNFHSLPQPERKPVMDALIDVISTIEVDQPVSGDAALAALPATRRVGTKPFHVEGCSELSGEWEPLLAGRRYSAFQAGVQLANRMGPLNEIEFSEFVVKAQAFADAVGGSPSFSDMLEEVARGRELDQFASAHDAQLSVTLMARAPPGAQATSSSMPHGWVLWRASFRAAWFCLRKCRACRPCCRSLLTPRPQWPTTRLCRPSANACSAWTFPRCHAMTSPLRACSRPRSCWPSRWTV